MSTSSWWIRGGRIVDPVSGRDEVADLVVENGVVRTPSTPTQAGTAVIDARGLTVVPGLTDVHVHFREPGDTDAETVATGSAAAARGGFTTVVTMPNTTPPTDSPETLRRTLERARQAGRVRVLPAACITSRREGRRVAALGELAAAGAAAFTDDGSTVPDEAVLEQAMIQAAQLDRPVLDHALDPAIAGDGVLRLGAASARLNLPGIPDRAETEAVARDIRLAARTGCRMHIQHISRGATVRLIRAAQQKGIPVSGEATPHHITLTDEDVPAEDANYKMNPPLGSEEDRAALLDGLCDGTIRVLATDHAPHTQGAKQRGFLAAPFGIVGLETAVGVTYTALVDSGRMSLADWILLWTAGPAAVLGRPIAGFIPGAVADMTLLDLEARWTIDPSRFVSRSRNTPFGGRSVKGAVAYTFCNGRMTWKAG